MNKIIRDQIISMMDDVDDLTVATNREDGYPQATTVSYVNDGITTNFGTSDGLQKAVNIARDDKVSAAINRPNASWDQIEGISLAGRATRVTDADEQAKIGERLMKKFPQIQDYAPAAETMGSGAFFRIDPEVISLLDYSNGFGRAELIEV